MLQFIFLIIFFKISSGAFVPGFEKIEADKIKYEGLPKIVGDLTGKIVIYNLTEP